MSPREGVGGWGDGGGGHQNARTERNRGITYFCTRREFVQYNITVFGGRFFTPEHLPKSAMVLNTKYCCIVSFVFRLRYHRAHEQADSSRNSGVLVLCYAAQVFLFGWVGRNNILSATFRPSAWRGAIEERLARLRKT